MGAAVRVPAERAPFGGARTARRRTFGASRAFCDRGTYLSASSNRGAGASTRASGTTDSAMRANPSRVGRRVAAAFAASASPEQPHRANAGRHERLASALIDAPSVGAWARAPVTTCERHLITPRRKLRRLNESDS